MFSIAGKIGRDHQSGVPNHRLGGRLQGMERGDHRALGEFLEGRGRGGEDGEGGRVSSGITVKELLGHSGSPREVMVSNCPVPSTVGEPTGLLEPMAGMAGVEVRYPQCHNGHEPSAAIICAFGGTEMIALIDGVG